MAQNPRMSETDSTPTTGRQRELTRRNYVRSLAAVATAATAIGGTGMAAAKEDYEVIEATGQIIQIGDGETFENKFIDLTTNESITIVVEGANSTVRNIGFDGLYRGDGFQFSITAPSGGVNVENIYLGDGATKEGESFVHGPGAVFYHKNANCDVSFQHCNVQGYPNNGFYCSNTASGGSVTFDHCYGKNNGVATYRCGGSNDVITNSVAYNDDTDYGSGYGGYIEEDGRPVWVWSPGPVTIEESNFAAGPYSGALFTHEGASIEFESGAYSGGAQGDIRSGDVSEDPDLSIPDGVPTDAEAAATGSAGSSSDE